MTKTAILSDIHGNSVALAAVLADIAAQGCEQIFCLGDTINGMDPGGSLALLYPIESFQMIKGNAEHYLLTPDLEQHPRQGEPLYQDLIALIEWWRAQLSPSDIEYLEGLPDALIRADGWLLHDSPLDRLRVAQMDIGDLDEKYRELSFHGVGVGRQVNGEARDQILALMDEKAVNTLFVGHTHEASVQHFGEKMIINPGSAGLPLDGDPRPSWVLLQPTATGWQPSIRRVDYDIEAAARRLRALGFRNFYGKNHQEAYIKMLQTGIHGRAHLEE